MPGVSGCALAEHMRQDQAAQLAAAQHLATDQEAQVALFFAVVINVADEIAER
jgi:hypothetical protein